jgi:hypothetical protein
MSENLYLPICKCCYFARVEPHRAKLPDGRPHPRPTCMSCGEREAKTRKHTIVPMPKSNYIVVTDRNLLLNLNSSHKGGR